MKRATFLAVGMLVWLGAIYATGTEETRRGLGAIASNLAVQLVLCGAAVVFLLSLCAAAWERADRRHAREARERAERLARAYLTETYRPRPMPTTSSLDDDSPHGPLPDEFRAPCGEPLRFPKTNSDRGPRAA